MTGPAETDCCDRAQSAEAERDAANAHAIECERIGMDAIEERLLVESALAKLRAGVEGLAGQWEADDEEHLDRFGQHLMGGSVLSCAEHLRALLKGGPDLIDHTLDEDCICGPTVEAVMREDGSNGWLYTHHSLDGREASE